jgi:hypothetical protein
MVKTMRKRLEGNGHTRETIVTHHRSEGYIIITAERLDAMTEQTPVFISKTLETWQKENPNCRVRCALPFVNDGQTFAIHVWYDGTPASA